MTTTKNNFISALVSPGPGSATAKKSWSIDVETVWVPFFTATNAMKETNITPETLGAPIRLGLQKDGSVRFSTTGRPAMRVAPELSAQIAVVRENFIASLQTYTGDVMDENPDAYSSQVAANQIAGTVLLEHDARLLRDEYARQELEAMLAAEEAARIAEGTRPVADSDVSGAETPAPTTKRPRSTAKLENDELPADPALAAATS